MRRRNIKGSRESVAEDDYVVHEPETYKGKWDTLFQNDHPIQVEIGMGKGKFIMELAGLHPEINYIGIEKYSSIMIRALEKRKEAEHPNLYFVQLDAVSLNQIFDTEEISGIYLNFSDPWPKDRHAKRRLPSKEFLRKYDQCLKRSGEVIFKTDNTDLFEFSLEQAKEAGWKLKKVTYDLHYKGNPEGNVMTEYEEKFVAEGKPIHRMITFRN